MKAIVSFFLFSLLMFPAVSFSYEKEIKFLAHDTAYLVAQSGDNLRIALVDFTDLQANVTELGRFLAEEISSNLSEINQIGLIEVPWRGLPKVPLKGRRQFFEVIDRTHLTVLLKEHQLSMTGVIDPKTARKVGEISGVQVLVTGSISPLGDNVRVIVKSLDTKTAKIIGSSRVDIPRTKAIDDLLTRGVSTPVIVDDPPKPSVPPVKALAKKPDNQEWWMGPRKAVVTMKDGSKISLTKMGRLQDSGYAWSFYINYGGGISEVFFSELISMKVGDELDNKGWNKATITRWDGKSISCTVQKFRVKGQSDFGIWTGNLGDVVQVDIIHTQK